MDAWLSESARLQRRVQALLQEVAGLADAVRRRLAELESGAPAEAEARTDAAAEAAEAPEISMLDLETAKIRARNLRESADRALLERGTRLAVLNEATRKLSEFEGVAGAGDARRLHDGGSPTCDRCLQPISAEHAAASLARLRTERAEAARGLEQAEVLAQESVSAAERAAKTCTALETALLEAEARRALTAQRAQHARDLDQRRMQQRLQRGRDCLSDLLAAIDALERGSADLEAAAGRVRGEAGCSGDRPSAASPVDGHPTVSDPAIDLAAQAALLCNRARLASQAVGLHLAGAGPGSIVAADTNPHTQRIAELQDSVVDEARRIAALRARVGDVEAKLGLLKPVRAEWRMFE